VTVEREPLHQIDDRKGLSDTIERVENATFVPRYFRNGRRFVLGGVLREDGSYVDNSACFIDQNRQPTHVPPADMVENNTKLSGNWLYGGRYDPRFGHFLVDNLSYG